MFYFSMHHTCLLIYINAAVAKRCVLMPQVIKQTPSNYCDGSITENHVSYTTSLHASSSYWVMGIV